MPSHRYRFLLAACAVTVSNARHTQSAELQCPTAFSTLTFAYIGAVQAFV
jgi:hypothetical protein